MSFYQVINELARPIVELSTRYNKSDMEVFVESKRPTSVAEAEYWMREYHNKNGNVYAMPLREAKTKRNYGIVDFLKGIKEAIVSAKMAKAHMIVNGTRGS